MPGGDAIQYIAKVTLNNETLMDVTDKTVSEENLLSGYTALANDGYPITGEYTPPLQENKTVTPSTSQQIVKPDTTYELITSFYAYSRDDDDVASPTKITKNIDLSAFEIGDICKIEGPIVSDDSNEFYIAQSLVNIDHEFIWQGTDYTYTIPWSSGYYNYTYYITINSTSLMIGFTTATTGVHSIMTYYDGTVQHQIKIYKGNSQYVGLKQVTVNPFVLQEKTVTPSSEIQVVKPDAGNIVDTIPAGTVGNVVSSTETSIPGNASKTLNHKYKITGSFEDANGDSATFNDAFVYTEVSYVPKITSSSNIGNIQFTGTNIYIKYPSSNSSRPTVIDDITIADVNEEYVELVSGTTNRATNTYSLSFDSSSLSNGDMCAVYGCARYYNGTTEQQQFDYEFEWDGQTHNFNGKFYTVTVNTTTVTVTSVTSGFQFKSNVSFCKITPYTMYDGLSKVTVNAASGGGGGSGTQVEEKLINFIDYDGTILHSYTAAEWSNVSALPSNPSHSGLVAQGWNWTKAQIDSYHTSYPNGIVWVGQMYTTASGATEIDITLDDPEYLSPYLTIAANGTVTVDWGDNTATSTVTGTSNTSLKYTLHEYANTGSYTIKLTVESGTLSIYSNSNGKSSILSVYGQDSNRRQSRRYSSKITAIRLGENALIGANAFAKDIGCKTITIPSSITSIGTYAFVDCHSLISLTIPNNVTSIGTTTFQNCYSLTSLTIPSSITTIGTYAFTTCQLLTSLTIPSGVTSIGNSAFQQCYSLTSLTIPSSVTSIGTYVFSTCYSLTSLTILSSITTIGNYTCQNCYSLTSLTIPSSITTIGNYAFTNCYPLTSLTIPSNITSIGANAFGSCYSLTSLTIPSSITSIGASAFISCVGIEEYHFLSTTPPTGGTTMFSNIITGTKIYVPYSADHSILEAYKTATNWSTYASYMEEEPQ